MSPYYYKSNKQDGDISVGKYTKVDDLLFINQKIFVDVKFGIKAGSYESRFEDIRDKSILISVPSDRGAFVPLSPGLDISVLYIGDGGRYYFQSKVLGRIKETIPLIEIEKPTVIHRKELREFFRINTNAKVKLLATRQNASANSVDNIMEAYVQDISGGGMRVSLRTRLEYNDEVEIYFSEMVPELKSTKAVVTRSVTLEEGRYEAGLKFLNINSVDRDRVIKYVFKRQLELRKLIG